MCKTPSANRVANGMNPPRSPTETFDFSGRASGESLSRVATIRLACDAMKTRFEFVLHGPNEVSLRAAGEEAIAEIHRIESALSLFQPGSEISAVNRDAATEPVRVTPEVYRLIEHAIVLSQLTQGAFDITVAPLLRVWGFHQGAGERPNPEELKAARACVGASLVELDPVHFRIGFKRPGIMLDLGSIGKGYALDRATEILQQAGIENALLHGGTSTAVGLGHPPDMPAWRIAIERPNDPRAETTPDLDPAPLAVVELKDTSLSVSAVWGKGFRANGRYYGHVIDPQTGEPVQKAWLAAIVLPSATESDALSTALLVRGREMLEAFRAGGPGLKCLVVEPRSDGSGFQVFSNAIDANVE